MTPSPLNRPRFAETLSRDGTCISYVARGRGRPLVVLRDRQPACAAWSVMAAHWPPGRQAVLPDPRGSGWSERPVHPGAYAMPRLVDDLEAVLTTTRDSVDLIAWSAAAQLALALARRPIATRVRRWILISGFSCEASHVPGFPAPPLLSPVLVLQGGLDARCSLQLTREFVRHQPHAHLEVLPDAGHDPMCDAPKRTWRLIDAFLAGPDQSPDATVGTRYSSSHEFQS
jgi:pimeloyl-ACP methyl ester carboxylesterase